MKSRLFLFLALTLLFVEFAVFAQDNVNVSTSSNEGADLEASAVDASRNIMLARSSTDYLVTPGDVYTLSYAAGATPVTYVISVDTSYRIRVSNLGVVNGAGKTFMQLKNEVETIVANNYPLSGVQLVLTQPAIFNVFVTGEVRSASEAATWALGRLSSLIGRNSTAFTSIRDISIRSTNGQTRVYDLFKAQRLGDRSQDPYLRPGDVITFNRVKRVVTVSGSVERPGTYQLLDGENITELINYYASGFTPLSDATRVELVRLLNSENIEGDKIFLTEKDLENNFALENFDTVNVPSITQLLPVLFVEGAASTNVTGTQLSVSNRFAVRFYFGETYAALTRRNIAWFSDVSDTENAYILRNDERIPIDISIGLYDANYRGSILVQENDILVIPFKQYFISVAGAVATPGRYPYIPDRDWEYYIGLAGGFIPERNANDSLTIVDINGNKRSKTDIISPETTITANSNHFMYYFNQYSPIIITTLSIISTFISTYLLINR